MKTIAVTGAPSSGKSTFVTALKGLGAYSFNSDLAGHQLLENDPECKKAALSLLSIPYIESQPVDRKKLAKIVFEDRAKLLALEKLLHPKIHQLMMQEMEVAKKQGACLFVAEVPLLFEAGWEKDFDKVVTIVAPDDASWRKKELIARAKLRKAKDGYSDFIIENRHSAKELKEQALALAQQLTCLERKSLPHAARE